MSPFDFDDFAKKLGYQERVGYYYRVPEVVNGLESKLVCITNDEVFNNMFDNLLHSRVVVIYFSHGISCGLLESQASINNNYVQQIGIFQTERQQSNTLQPEKSPQLDVLEFNWVDVDVQEEEATTESDDEFIDSDYEQDEEGLGVSFEQNEDDIIYVQNVEGSNKEDIQNEIRPEEQEFDGYNSEDLKSLYGNSSSDEEPNSVNRRRIKKKLPKFKQFRRETDIRTIEFHLGMVFANAKEFKEAVKWHFVNHCRSYKFKINDWYKVKAVCKVEPCPWFVYASSNNLSDRHSPLHVKTLVPNHTCGTDENNTSVTSTWLAERYVDDLSMNPKMDVKTMKAMVRKDYMAQISRWKAYRVRSIVNEKLEGSYQEQYSILRDYCEELKRSNPGETVFPSAEHRHRVGHLYNNFKLLHKGLELKQRLWAAARTTTVPWFNVEMSSLQKLDDEAYKWIKKENAHYWSRSHFSEHPKCDILLNNLYEAFNSAILDARDKPILTMLGPLRMYMMLRMAKQREACDKWHGDIGPRIHTILEKNKVESSKCFAHLAGQKMYQVVHMSRVQFAVDLAKHTCTCRGWNLTGIPCGHAIACIC
ncbi:hypothetical protein L3X38_018002 [Prunus dulcis]|uniref:SWIM-type domain-containing protein n=1 Tax=Prunus dulcis TaxID=3755 RepID=A0AAD4W863_PRUDU|nr:hypothetical protein L3X38_018002 [Prunus dulcis]